MARTWRLEGHHTLTALLEIAALTKAYPGVVANDHVSFSVDTGEIHALLGENGAGKSTLVKMIYGLVKPDSGTMLFDSKPHAPDRPGQARQAGVAMVFQHFSLFEALTVAENIALGMENPPKRAALSRKITEVAQSYGLPLDPMRLIGDLSAGERQRVEIIRCLLQDPKLLIMDEPSLGLSPALVKMVFSIIPTIRASGITIVLVEQNANMALKVADFGYIMENGRFVTSGTAQELTEDEDVKEFYLGIKLEESVKGEQRYKRKRRWG